MPLRINAIRSPAGQHVELGPFNVLVGPNNSGKSQTLRDIREYVTTGSSSRLVVLRDIDVRMPDEAEALNNVRQLPHDSPGHKRLLGVSYDLQSQHDFAPQENWVEQQYRGEAREQLLRHLGRFWVAHLDAESRLRLANATDCYDTRTESPQNALQAFFADRARCQQDLRQAFREAFNTDVGLDWASMRRWYLRVSADFGDIPDERDALDNLMQNAEELSAQGDGFRSFAGVVLAMLTFRDRLLLLDEPEAFLHPAQARALGRWLGNHVRAGESQVILATHNADFLWGVVSSNPDTRVIRLNRRENTSTFHVVAPETTQDLVRSPLLSSQPVLDALFQRGVVVCEGDPDRAIYQTVAHGRFGAQGGEEVLFIHTNGKDAIKSPVDLLKAAGTPVCAIVDFDVLNSEAVVSDLLTSLDGPADDVNDRRRQLAEQIEQQDETQLRSALIASVREWMDTVPQDLRRARSTLRALADANTKWTQVKAKGIRALPAEGAALAEQIMALCDDLGLFIVPAGQLESWMDLGVSKGRRWNRLALETLHRGECPEDLEAFVGKVLEFLRRPR